MLELDEDRLPYRERLPDRMGVGIVGSTLAFFAVANSIVKLRWRWIEGACEEAGKRMERWIQEEEWREQERSTELLQSVA